MFEQPVYTNLHEGIREKHLNAHATRINHIKICCTHTHTPFCRQKYIYKLFFSFAPYAHIYNKNKHNICAIVERRKYFFSLAYIYI